MVQLGDLPSNEPFQEATPQAGPSSPVLQAIPEMVRERLRNRCGLVSANVRPEGPGLEGIKGPSPVERGDQSNPLGKNYYNTTITIENNQFSTAKLAITGHFQ